jgi:hypothetical protein
MNGRIVGLIACAVFPASLLAEPFEEARVTETINIVSLLQQLRKPQPATVGDVIKGQTALKTGGESRAELKFPDLTMTRVGANSLFRFYAGGRDMVLDGGTMLFYSPKGAGGGKVQAGAVTAAVTGSAIMVMNLGSKINVACLEHAAVVSGPGFTRKIRAGQVIDQTGKVTNISLQALAKSSNLCSGFSTALPFAIKSYRWPELNPNLDTNVDQTGQVARRTINRDQQSALVNNPPVQSQSGSPRSLPISVVSRSNGSVFPPTGQPGPPTGQPAPPTDQPGSPPDQPGSPPDQPGSPPDRPPTVEPGKPGDGQPDKPRRGTRGNIKNNEKRGNSGNNRSNIRNVENRGNSGNAPGRTR